eukprot:gene22737-31024_t
MAAFDRDAATMRVIEELKRLYKTKILPLEQMYRFDLFNSPYLTDAEFDSKPQVMLLGQYSVGKTTFIRYLLGRDFPGQRIGPEPTTDRFTALIDGPDERIIPGNALAVSHDMPYRGLERFGVAFLNRFEGSQLPSPVLRNITLIDTPGVLRYDFCQVCGWFANRADLIVLIFDAHKLDISDEFRNAIESLKGNDDKIRCILNKADQVDRQKLMRVYGALMWRSFWDQPLMYDDNAELFQMEEKDLMKDLKELPRNSAVRKINELVKRVRLCKVHAYIIGYLHDQMPSLFGKAKKQAELIEALPQVFRSVMKKWGLAAGDFPDLHDFQDKLREHDFSKFNSLKPRLVEDAETVLGNDFPRLMEALPRSYDPSGSQSLASNGRDINGALVYDAPPARTSASVGKAGDEDNNPWTDDASNPFGEPADGASSGWELAEYIPTYTPQFNTVQKGGFVTGGAAKGIMSGSGLPTATLRKIWELSDCDRDGQLDLNEFVLAMVLIEGAKNGEQIPAQLDPAMIPPGK